MTPPAVPCTVCRTTGGPMQANTHRPARIDMTRHGVPGLCCHNCACAVRYRLKAGLCPITGRRPAPRRGLPTLGDAAGEALAAILNRRTPDPERGPR